MHQEQLNLIQVFTSVPFTSSNKLLSHYKNEVILNNHAAIVTVMSSVNEVLKDVTTTEKAKKDAFDYFTECFTLFKQFQTLLKDNALLSTILLASRDYSNHELKKTVEAFIERNKEF